MVVEFQNVDAGSLISALQACKSSLDHSKSDNLPSSLSTGIWQGRASDVLRESLTTFSSSRYQALEAALDSYIGVAGMIQEYKELESENQSYQATINSLQSKLHKEEKTKDKDGNEQTKIVVDKNVEADIKNYEKKIKDNEKTMIELANQIKGSV